MGKIGDIEVLKLTGKYIDMRKITFTGQVQSNYRAIVRSSSSLSNTSRSANSFRAKPNSIDTRNKNIRTVARAVAYTNVGNTLRKEVDKNKQRFLKSGPKSRIGKIANDTKLGASAGAALGFLKGAGNSLTTPGSVKKKIAYGLGHATKQALKGGIGGGSLGAGIGTTRGFIQPNKKKSLLDKFKK